MHLALVEPEIPQNTGNVSRTCVMTGTRLHLVEPLGFSISQKEVRRSGLDYWRYLNLSVHPDFETLQKALPDSRYLLFSTRGDINYSDIVYRHDDLLVFGSETKGLAPEILDSCRYLIRIPMVEQIPRSLNLGNAVALVLYEALRQQGFPGMS